MPACPVIPLNPGPVRRHREKPRLTRHLNQVSFVLALVAALSSFRPVRAIAADSTQTQIRMDDVIAFVGGEDAVAMGEFGYVEVLLAGETALKNVRFRNLGWEGDTVFEQRRDLNFPSWEQTLEKIGATLVIARFGQTESLRGRDALPQFREAAIKLFGRLAGTNRQLIVVAPTPFEKPARSLPDLTTHHAALRLYSDELRQLCRIQHWTFVDSTRRRASRPITRDGLHLNADGHWLLANRLHVALRAARISPDLGYTPATGQFSNHLAEQLRQAIIAKNQLWFDYWRPQNWAFLAGDRTEQPSSRDHRNPKVRWFPNEMEQFLPLIEAKERDVKRLSETLAGSPGR
jgi:hypothetical protein